MNENLPDDDPCCVCECALQLSYSWCKRRMCTLHKHIPYPYPNGIIDETVYGTTTLSQWNAYTLHSAIWPSSRTYFGIAPARRNTHTQTHVRPTNGLFRFGVECNEPKIPKFIVSRINFQMYQMLDTTIRKWCPCRLWHACSTYERTESSAIQTNRKCFLYE